jgi:hypothetical protein
MTRERQDGRIHPLLAIVLAVVALLLLVLIMRGCFHGAAWVLGHDSGPGWLLWSRTGAGLLPFGLWFVIHLVLAFWVGTDAEKKGQNGILWGLLVFFTGIVGLIVYLIVAPWMAERNGGGAPAGARAPAPACPRCRAALRPEYKACPHCGASLSCPQCGQAVQGDWNVCPFCTARLKTGPTESS